MSRTKPASRDNRVMPPNATVERSSPACRAGTEGLCRLTATPPWLPSGFDSRPGSLHNFAPFTPHSYIQEHIVANIKSAKKRAKQAEVRRGRNASARSMLRTAVKKVIKAIETK